MLTGLVLDTNMVAVRDTNMADMKSSAGADLEQILADFINKSASF